MGGYLVSRIICSRRNAVDMKALNYILRTSLICVTLRCYTSDSNIVEKCMTSIFAVNIGMLYEKHSFLHFPGILLINLNPFRKRLPCLNRNTKGELRPKRPRMGFPRIYNNFCRWIYKTVTDVIKAYKLNKSLDIVRTMESYKSHFATLI